MVSFYQFGGGVLVIGLVYAGVIPTYIVGLVVLVIGILYACKWKFIDGPMHTAKTSLAGKTVIITGANSGIGLETAVDLSRRGARVIMACRNKLKGQKAVETVIARSQNKQVVFSQVDLASLKSVRAFSARMLEEEPHIDILINNAAVMIPPHIVTEDGLELQFSVNYLAHFLLTNLLLERLKVAPAARVVNISAGSHYFCNMNFDDLQYEREYHPHLAYRQTKLALILFTQVLAKKLEKTNVTTYTLQPGIVKTKLFRHANIAARLLVRVAGSLFMRTPTNGAQTTIFCAVSEDITEKSGQYFANFDVKKLKHPQALDYKVAERLWQISTKLAGLEDKKP